SLFLYPATCAAGSGYCLTCPGVFSNSITLADPAFTNRLFTSGVASSCAVPKSCPGTNAAIGPFHFDTFHFTNTSEEHTSELSHPSHDVLHSCLFPPPQRPALQAATSVSLAPACSPTPLPSPTLHSPTYSSPAASPAVARCQNPVPERTPPSGRSISTLSPSP